ncbi:zinc ribbon domain-containing protein [Cohnella sp. JJ-181]|uniref:zinc ribbon domain-containing protein n=1 Tax=Cohnella rhizoplanae TaxID=2974897 RepID=UPI0022FF9511|nr:zinc ribbon domain-containing protein [Cohnella sp. JJ-181]CAI6085087.1 hypothetical protein COHCIP112018_04554 [Cohnella sp. JJ-181]
MECPYCQAEIEQAGGRCPSCKRRLYEVTEDDFEEEAPSVNGVPVENGAVQDSGDGGAVGVRDLVAQLEDRFVCGKCGHHGGLAKEIAMTGAGLSKLFDIQHNHYLFVSCERCGSVEIFDPEVLLGRKPGKLGSALDVLFGG